MIVCRRALRHVVLATVALAACSGHEPRGPQTPLVVTAPPQDAVRASDATPAIDVAPAIASAIWLKGSTHVHAAPSGDSSTPIPEVIRWYETRGYDFIALTDHNRISEIDPATSTAGSPAVRASERGLIVLAGAELTHNPTGCLPATDPSDKCRIHVNLLGPTRRPGAKIEWAPHATRSRADKYLAALEQRAQLDGVLQINHPNWFWGLTPELLVLLAGRGFPLLEIHNVQFAAWNAGDATHPSTEALWDSALATGATVWGVASDDAHDYSGRPGAVYPAGGAWIMVRSEREPAAIVEAIAAGRFYASTGVVLARAEVEGDALVVEVAAGEVGHHVIDIIENGKPVERVEGRVTRRPVPARGYVRAVVSRDDGAHAWVQPARR